MAQKKYTQEFKDSTIQLALNSGEKIPKIAQDLDLHVKTLYAWINAYKRSNNIPTRAKKQFQEPNKKECLEEELKRVKKELAIAKQERDILKKATAYFAKETI
ncbi:transposase [Poseidonibacter ostreae]|uniref:Transposase n=1 Tax=Poseidonibacter ostreae TaxID=2654171 RepID=A0A6L4WR01_9BACT|nr:transposase [Poseidonibacter ostreae]KAB7884628.1 transposase [Poseidonibacter ostreae]KAB7885721.1 transposase [Poseidonibacter ostreae]KAB7887919.1 transposase [Poseidonibacter ostreae]